MLKDMLSGLKKCDFKDVVVPMGIDENGKYVYENFAKMNNTFIIGDTNSGKTVFMHNLALSLINQLDSSKVDLVIIDPKMVEFDIFKQKKYNYFAKIEEISLFFRELDNELERRQALFDECKVKSFEEYNAINGSHDKRLKHIVVLIDECADIVLQKSDFYEIFTDFLQKSEKFGVFFVISTQRISLFEKDFVKLFTSHLVFRLSEQKNSELFLSPTNDMLLEKKGDAVVSIGDNSYKVQTPFISYQELGEMLKENDGEKFCTLSSEQTYSYNVSPKMILLNAMKTPLESELSKYIFLYDNTYNEDLFSREDLKDCRSMIVLCKESENIDDENIKSITCKAQTEKLEIIYMLAKDKQMDEVISLCNELASMLYEPSIINIEEDDIIGGGTIVDGFVVERNDKVDFQKEYLDTLEKYIKKNKDTARIIVSICGGYNNLLDKVMDYVNLMQKLIPEDVGVVFGLNANDEGESMNKITVLFQTGGERKRLESTMAKSNEHIEAVESSKESHDSEYYKSRIDEFCKKNVVSGSLIQRYFSVGFHTACELIDKWEESGIVKTDEKFRRVLDKENLRESLYEFFKNKL